MEKYLEFIKQKTPKPKEYGFDIAENEINPRAKEHQRYTIKRALRSARFGVFLDCGLGKTLISHNWAQQVASKSNKPVLIACPKNAISQTIREGKKFGYNLTRFNNMQDIEYQMDCMDKHSKPVAKIYITNYEKAYKFPVNIIGGIALDESSILKNFEGKFRNQFISNWKGIKFKLSLSATPSPNDPIELANQAEFLGVMDRQEVLANYFINDMKIGGYRLKKHAVNDFYEWVASWAVMASKPSDIGFPDTGYVLPKLNIFKRDIKTPKKNNGKLFNDSAVNATEYYNELKITLLQRIEEAVEIVGNSKDQWIIWGRLNDECEELEKHFQDSVNVAGGKKDNEKNLELFQNGEIQTLITKGKIAGMGMNFQNCHNQVFASPDFSLEQIYQQIRRSYRFGQEHEVNIYLIIPDTMANVMEIFEEKHRQFERMQRMMTKAMNKKIKTKNMEERKHKVKTGEMYELYLGDAVSKISYIEDNSIGLLYCSPPFKDLYTYSDDPADMSNCKSWEEFKDHFKFILPEWKRVLMPGRLLCLHCTYLSYQVGRDGFQGVQDFPGELEAMLRDAGFIQHSARITIDKDPEEIVKRSMNRATQLMVGQMKKDSSKTRPAYPDYILMFRKPGENEIPITHQEEDPAADDYISYRQHCDWMHPVWTDIDATKTLNAKGGRHANDERHMTPTQLQPTERVIKLWSNPGEIVLDTFSGIATTGVVAIKNGRRYKGIELKETYFDLGDSNLKEAEYNKFAKTLFD